MLQDITALISGIAIGLAMAIPIGPVGIITVQRTMTKSKMAGLMTGFGAVLADGFISVIGAFGVKIIYDFVVREETILRLIGGCILVIIGIVGIVSKVKVELKKKDSAITYTEYFISAVFLAITNPLSTIVMFGIFTEIGPYIGIEKNIVAIYLVVGVMLGSLLWWLFLTHIADVFGHKIKPEYIQTMNKWFGIIITVLGVIMLVGVLLK